MTKVVVLRKQKNNNKALGPMCNQQESRRGREEGGELDSQEEASPEEIKSGVVVLG